MLDLRIRERIFSSGEIKVYQPYPNIDIADIQLSLVDGNLGSWYYGDTRIDIDRGNLNPKHLKVTLRHKNINSWAAIPFLVEDTAAGDDLRLWSKFEVIIYGNFFYPNTPSGYGGIFLFVNRNNSNTVNNFKYFFVNMGTNQLIVDIYQGYNRLDRVGIGFDNNRVLNLGDIFMLKCVCQLDIRQVKGIDNLFLKLSAELRNESSGLYLVGNAQTPQFIKEYNLSALNMTSRSYGFGVFVPAYGRDTNPVIAINEFDSFMLVRRESFSSLPPV